MTVICDIEKGSYISIRGTPIGKSPRELTHAEKLYKAWMIGDPCVPILNIIINTCALTKDKEILKKRGSYGSGATYGSRVAALRRTLREYDHPALRVVVVGEWEPGKGYLYVEDPGETKSPEDQAQQRSTGEVYCDPFAPILYLNDDHYLPLRDILPTLEELPKGGVLAFPRVSLNLGGIALPTGWPDYVHGHASMAHQDALMDGLTWDLVDPSPDYGKSWERSYGWQADLQYTYHMRRLGVPAALATRPVINLEEK